MSETIEEQITRKLALRKNLLKRQDELIQQLLSANPGDVQTITAIQNEAKEILKEWETLEDLPTP